METTYNCLKDVMDGHSPQEKQLLSLVVAKTLENYVTRHVNSSNGFKICPLLPPNRFTMRAAQGLLIQEEFLLNTVRKSLNIPTENGENENLEEMVFFFNFKF